VSEPARSLRPDAASEEQRLRAVDAPRRGARFAAVDHDVARVLGPQRGPLLIYGHLSTAWYEFATPEKLAEIRKKTNRTIVPGDWVEVSYTDLMAIAGTRSKDSVIRWLRAIAEDTYPCPWGRCGGEHPLIVVDRQGCNRNNRYRRWRCGEDELVPRRRVRSEKLRARARERVARAAAPSEPEVERTSGSPMIGLPLDGETDFRESGDRTSESPVVEQPEVRPPPDRKSDDRTFLHENRENDGYPVVESIETASANGAAAAPDVEDVPSDVDAVAVDVIEALLSLGQRVQPDYTEDRAWIVARRLATVALDVAGGRPASARSLLLHAIADPRLARAKNPVGWLIRGVTGDQSGTDRFLLTSGSDPGAEVAVAVTASVPAETVARPKGHDVTVASEFDSDETQRLEAALNAMSASDRAKVEANAISVIGGPQAKAYASSRFRPALLHEVREYLERQLDERAMRVLGDMDAAARQELEATVTASFGPLASRFRESPLFETVLISAIKVRLAAG